MLMPIPEEFIFSSKTLDRSMKKKKSRREEKFGERSRAWVHLHCYRHHRVSFQGKGAA